MERAVIVRLADGRVLYWYGDGVLRSSPDWGPRYRQAHRFASREEAQGYADICETNVSARACDAVPLPRNR